MALSHIFAIDEIERIARAERIECDFERSMVTCFSPLNISDGVEKEIEAASRAGLDGLEIIERAPLNPFKTPETLRFPIKRNFHPLKYWRGCVKRSRNMEVN